MVDSETPPTTCLQICEEMARVEDLPFIAAGSRRYAWRADDTHVCGLSFVWTSLFRESMGQDSSVEQIIGRLVLQQDRVKLVVLKGF